MSQHQSCMVRHFQHYGELSARNIELLEMLEKSPEHLSANDVLWLEGGSANELAVISHGWAYSYRNLEDGTRLILDILLPGDIIGLREFATEQHLTSVEVITDCTICRFPHDHLGEIFEQSSRLTRIFFAVASTQQSMLVERMVNLGRRDAAGRVAHFLCEMHTRLSHTNPQLQDAFHLPLSQQMLADTMGLSSVHVSRVFSQLRDQALVHRDRHRIRIPDLDKLIEFADFSGNYLGMPSAIQNRQSLLRRPSARQ